MQDTAGRWRDRLGKFAKRPSATALAVARERQATGTSFRTTVSVPAGLQPGQRFQVEVPTGETRVLVCEEVDG